MDCFLKMSGRLRHQRYVGLLDDQGAFERRGDREFCRSSSNAATSAGANVEVAAGGGGGGPELAGCVFGGNGRRTVALGDFEPSPAGASVGSAGRGTGRAASACSMRCNWRTAIAMPTSRRPPTAAIVPGVTTSAPKVPSGRITPDATRADPATAVAAPKTSKNIDMTLIPAPVRCRRYPAPTPFWPSSDWGARINSKKVSNDSGEDSGHHSPARHRCPDRAVGLFRRNLVLPRRFYRRAPKPVPISH